MSVLCLDGLKNVWRVFKGSPQRKTFAYFWTLFKYGGVKPISKNMIYPAKTWYFTGWLNSKMSIKCILGFFLIQSFDNWPDFKTALCQLKLFQPLQSFRVKKNYSDTKSGEKCPKNGRGGGQGPFGQCPTLSRFFTWIHQFDDVTQFDIEL